MHIIIIGGKSTILGSLNSDAFSEFNSFRNMKKFKTRQ